VRGLRRVKVVISLTSILGSLGVVDELGKDVNNRRNIVPFRALRRFRKFRAPMTGILRTPYSIKNQGQ